MSVCANTPCEQVAKNKCAACGMVSYCGQNCQKAHWNAHKTLCKANRKPTATPEAIANANKKYNSSVTAAQQQQQQQEQQQQQMYQQYQQQHVQIDPALAHKMSVIKNQTQVAFQSGNFEASLHFGYQALNVTKELPEPVRSVEAIQVLLNLSTAYLQLGKLADADNQSLESVKVAEQSVLQRQNHPQAIDMLAATLTTRAFVMLNLNRIDDGEHCASRAIKYAESIFQPRDPRLFKTFRVLGLINARKEQFDDAESYLRKAYEAASSANGPVNGDAQLVVDELVQILLRIKKLVEAESFMKSNYAAIEETVADDLHPLIGEAAAKYASVLMNRGKYKDAEIYLTKSLKVREKQFGMSSHQVAMTLLGLANIREQRGDFSEEVEQLLNRALDILKNGSNTPQSGIDDSQNSTHILNCIAFIKRVRMRRESYLAGDSAVETVDDEEEEVDRPGNKTNSKSSDSLARSGTKTARPTPFASAQSRPRRNREHEPYENPTEKLDPSDGINRMRMAAGFFETSEFSKAEIVLQEAYDIFMKQHGPNNPNTHTCKQNLDIVRQNAITQLWHEVMLEEKEKLAVQAMRSLSLEDSSADKQKDIIIPDFKYEGADNSSTEVWANINENIWRVENEPKASTCSIQ